MTHQAGGKAKSPRVARSEDVPVLPRGARLWRGLLGGEEGRILLKEVRQALRVAPPFVPRMPRTGRPFSVRMSNFGPLGWVSDARGGYRYQLHHPQTARPWPPLPEVLLRLWERLAGFPAPPDAGLINLYPPGARMGLHVDRDEEALEAPILSVSLGCEALFRLGGARRRDATISFRLRHGDVLLLAGPARLAHHGVDRVYPDLGPALEPFARVARINITLRRVRRARD